MFKNFEDMQKFSKEQLDAASAVGATVSKSVQEIAAEVTDYSKKSVEGASAAFEKLVASKSIESVLQVQGDFADFVEEQGALIRQFEAAFAAFGRARKGPAFMAEKFAFD